MRLVLVVPEESASRLLRSARRPSDHFRFSFSNFQVTNDPGAICKRCAVSDELSGFGVAIFSF